MKKFILLALLVTVNLSAFAQDLIVLKDGTVIKSKVTEIGIQEIRYKKWSNLEGPSYVIEKSDVLSINYENGEVESFKETSSGEAIISANKNDEPTEIHASPCIENSQILSRYNRVFESIQIKPKSKIARNFIAKYAFTSESILSNEHIEVFFKMPYWQQYEIWIRNKTDNPIVIDLMNTFRSDSNGASRTYYNASETISVTSGQGHVSSVNLGAVGGSLGIGGQANALLSGINVGGGNSHSLTTTFNNERYVVIAPRGSAPISTWKEIITEQRLGTIYKKWVTYGEFLSNSNPLGYYYSVDSKGKVRYGSRDGARNTAWLEQYKDGIGPIEIKDDLQIGESIILNTSNTPLQRDYSILYYLDNNLQTYSKISFGLYIRQIIGCKTEITGSCHFSSDYQREFDLIGSFHN